MMTPSRLARLCLTLLFALPDVAADVAAGAQRPTGENASKRSIGIDTTFGDLVHEAGAALRARRYEEVIAKASTALAMKPDGKNAAILLCGRGVSYEALGRFSSAFTDYSEAVRRDPTVKYGRRHLADLYASKGEFQKALAELDRVPKNDSPPEEVQFTRGNIHLHMGRADLARNEFEKVSHLRAKDCSNYAARGHAHNKLGQYAAAASDLATAKRMSPGDEYVLNEVAWFEATCPEAKFRNGRAAITDATRACERGKWRDPLAIDTLAAAYAEVGDFERAINYENQAITLADALPYRKSQLQADMRLFQERKPVREELKIK
jgi:tetratricopeptide (TPR) repeat protein